jgi:hypothetical protein
MDITHMGTTIRIAIHTTAPIGIMGTIGLTMGTADTVTTVTTDITTTIGGNKLI